MPKDERIEKALEVLKQSKDRAANTIKLLRFHKKRDRFALNYLRHYLPRRDFRLVWGFIKQGKAKVRIRRLDYSFLISGRDLLPVVISQHLPKDINKVIRERFFLEKNRDFSGKARLFLPEYIGPRIAAERRVKNVLSLVLFSPNISVKLIGESRIAKHLVNSVKLFSDINIIAGYKENSKYDLNLTIRRPQLGRFEEIANRASKVVYIRKGDMDFLQRYISDAMNLEIRFSKKLKKKFRRQVLLDLAEASARMEMRRRVSKQDIERIKQLNL